MALAITIGGASQTARLRRIQNIDVEYTLGSMARLSCEILDTQANTATAYRPTTDQTVLLADGATTLHAGTIIRVNDSAIAQPRRGVLTQIEGVDTWRAAAYRLVSKSYPAGQTLKQIVTDLVTTYLTTYGITLDAGMANGPTMADVTFDYVPVESAFSTLSDLTGWVYRLLPSNVLEMFSIGSKTSSFSLTASNIRGGVRWGKTRGIYVNRQFVRAGSSAQVQKTWTVTGDGATNTWTLEYPGVQLPNGGLVVTSLLVADSATGALLPIGILGTGPSLYYNYNPATNQVVRTMGNLPGGQTASMTYMAQFPIVVVAEDAAEIAAHDEWESLVEAPEIYDRAEALALAAGLLRRYKTVPRALSVATRAGLSFPGSVITITLPERTVTGSWLITATRIRDEVDGGLTYEYDLLEGTEAQASWIDFWRSAFGAMSSGTVVVSGAGAGAGGSIVRPSYFLGGNGIEATQSPTPTWVPASGGGAIGQGAIQVRLNTAARGTTLATVIVRLRALAAGISVQARLYNTTDSVAVSGVSPVVTSTSWQTVQFDVTLTEGIREYELQLLPGAANADVMGVGSVE